MLFQVKKEQQVSFYKNQMGNSFGVDEATGRDFLLDSET